VALVATAIPALGCAHGPRRFGKFENPGSLARARAVGLAVRQPDSAVVPALVSRLGDIDPVVRMAAHEELRRRTGQDFGYVPWASPEERTSAIGRWQGWLAGRNASGSEGRMPTPQSFAPASVPGKGWPADAGARPSS
jgi:hypothetical protein